MMGLNKIKFGYVPIDDGYGYYLDAAPKNVLEELGQQINTLQNNFSKGKKYNDLLAGEIQHEYKIDTQPQTKQYIKNLTQRFEKASQHIAKNYNFKPSLIFNDLWVNFQKKHEYNPMHSHSGVYSFVIWYKIPYTFENEAKYTYKSASKAKRECHHGRFLFIIPSKNDRFRLNVDKLEIDKSQEGLVAIFPSTLDHIVYPFYSSDEYRITVAGNIRDIKDRDR